MQNQFQIINKPIRVLHIIRTMNIGGAEIFIMNVYRSIDRKKVQFDFLVNGIGIFDNEIRSLGGKVYYMKYITQIGEISYFKKLKAFFKEHSEYITVHSHLDQVSGIVLKAANKAGIINRISHSHSTSNTNNIVGKIYKKYLQHMLIPNATAYYGCSIKACEWLFGKYASKSVIIKNGVNMNKFKFDLSIREQMRRKLKISNSTIVIGHVGRLTKPKNHLFLLDIFKNINTINPDSCLILCGSGSQKEEIQKKIKKLAIEKNVIMVENMLNVSEIYQSIDIFIFPSIYEGLPLTLIEAQANGLPIYCSDTVTKEVNITQNIQYISLLNAPQKWANLILSNENKRYDKFDLMINSEYSVEKVSKKFEEIYINMYKASFKSGKELL